MGTKNILNNNYACAFIVVGSHTYVYISIGKISGILFSELFKKDINSGDISISLYIVTVKPITKLNIYKLYLKKIYTRK